MFDRLFEYVYFVDFVVLLGFALLLLLLVMAQSFTNDVEYADVPLL